VAIDKEKRAPLQSLTRETENVFYYKSYLHKKSPFDF
jgi:hypothetical protein